MLDRSDDFDLRAFEEDGFPSFRIDRSTRSPGKFLITSSRTRVFAANIAKVFTYACLLLYTIPKQIGTCDFFIAQAQHTILLSLRELHNS